MTHRPEPESVAAKRIRSELENNGRSVRWLAEQTGIPYPTLRRKLTHRPDTLLLAELITITTTLGITIAQLVEHELAAV